MVAGVQGSVGSSAYVKSSQLGSANNNSGSVESFKKELTETREDSGSTETKKAAEIETRNRDEQSGKTTQLQERNEQQTLSSEQTRGSLLDIAV